MTRERALAAKAAEVQLLEAARLLRQAVGLLEALKYGVQPGLDYARAALRECEKSAQCTTDLLDRIPEDLPRR